MSSTSSVAIVVPNWNGMDSLATCLDSLLAQTFPARIIVVENGSTDGSLAFLEQNYPQVELVVNQTNLGFAGGVNAGIRKSIADGDDFVALFNNDAVADKDWLRHLVEDLEAHAEAGIATCKLLDSQRTHVDSTGDIYTIWGLPYPRGRGEEVSDKYDALVEVFGASGGASLYRTRMLQEIGLFDEDFFAYYEDVDISFRAQLAGWKVRYVPTALAYHQIGATSSKIKGFTTYQTMKNYPWLLWKNAPASLLIRILPRFTVAHGMFMVSALTRGQGWPALKGFGKSVLLFPKKLGERWNIQRQRKVSSAYIWSIMTHELPPNAHKLRRLFYGSKQS